MGFSGRQLVYRDDVQLSGLCRYDDRLCDNELRWVIRAAELKYGERDQAGAYHQA
jgi:hypothetical protein